MWKRILCIVIVLFSPVGVLAQTPVTSYPAGWSPIGATVTLAVTGTTSSVQLGWAAVKPLPIPAPANVQVCNKGTVDASVALGNSSITATTANYVVLAGACPLMALNGAQYIAAISNPSGTTTLTISTGNGSASNSSSPGGGAAPGNCGGIPCMADTGMNATAGALRQLATNAGTAQTLSLGTIGSAAAFWSPTYFTNPGTGVVTRLNRVFVGEATLGSSDIPMTTPDWLETLSGGTTSSSQFASISTIGDLGVLGAARSSDYRTWAGAATGGAQGVTGIGWNDDTGSGTPIAGGVVGGGFRAASVNGITFGAQLYAANAGSTVDITPQGGVVSGSTIASLLTAGPGPTGYTQPISAGAVLGNDGSTKARKGYVSLNGVLDTSVGTSGGGVAFELGDKQELRWLDNSNVVESTTWADSSGYHVGSALFTTGNIDITSSTLFVHSPGQDSSLTINPNNGPFIEIDALNNAASSTEPLIFNRFGGNVLLGTTTDCGVKLCINGGITASLSTSGTIAGAACLTSAGLFLYESGINCFPGSGSGAEQTITYQPGLLAAVNATQTAFVKFVKASTIDNIIGSASTFSCVSNPTVTLTDTTTSTTIGVVTVTSAGVAFAGTISSAGIAAGDVLAWATTSGTCASIDIAATAQAHQT